MGRISVSKSVVCINNDTVFRGFRNNITFTVYVTACDLDMSFIFVQTDEITSDM